MKLIESKITAWCAMLLVVALVVIAVMAHTPWWGFIAIFFAFLAVFSHLASLYLKKMSPRAAGKLENCAFVLCILAVVGLIAVYIISNIQEGL